jgi:hypothetical protein
LGEDDFLEDKVEAARKQSEFSTDCHCLTLCSGNYHFDCQILSDCCGFPQRCGTIVTG